MKIGVIDYGVGNIANVMRCLEHIDIPCEITRIFYADEVEKCDKLILPGVGAFGIAMQNLKARDFDKAVLDFAKSGRYILGICLGMQLLFTRSYEFGKHEGLGVIEGEVVKFGDLESSFSTSHTQDLDSDEMCDSHTQKAMTDNDLLGIEDSHSALLFDKANTRHLKIPHIGWNKNLIFQEHEFLKGLDKEFHLYFVHSYHAVCAKKYVLAECEYGVCFPSIVCNNNILGIQPHPERSHKIGFQIMHNFIAL